MSTKVITIRQVEEIPEGSVFEAEREIDGEQEYWTGLWSSMWGSYVISVPVECCEEFDEDVHDPMRAYWKRKYAEERADDKPGVLPERFLFFAMRDLKHEIEKAKERKYDLGNDDLVNGRREYWLASLEAYYKQHFPDKEVP